MADVNHVILIGRLTRDAALTYTSGGMAICKFAIAVNARVKQGESWADEASFFDVTVFGKAAEAINQYLVKGKQVAVDGRLKQDRWEKDGQNHSRVVINADNVQLLGGGEARPDNQARQPQASDARRQGVSGVPANQGYDDQPDPAYFPDDVPF